MYVYTYVYIYTYIIYNPPRLCRQSCQLAICLKERKSAPESPSENESEGKKRAEREAECKTGEERGSMKQHTCNLH